MVLNDLWSTSDITLCWEFLNILEDQAVLLRISKVIFPGNMKWYNSMVKLAIFKDYDDCSIEVGVIKRFNVNWKLEKFVGNYKKLLKKDFFTGADMESRKSSSFKNSSY